MFTAMDVYDAASSIGRDCQLIVSQYGSEVLQDLMPKIISVLEDLETCSLYCEKEIVEVARLREAAECLRSDCRTQAELQEKVDQTLEQMEQSWYCETQRLLNEVATIEEENNRLAHQLASELADPRTTDVHDGSEIKPTISSVLRAAASGRPVDLPTSLQIAEVSVDEIDSSTNSGDENITNVLFQVGERLQLTEQENRAADLQLIGRLKECVSANYKEIRALSRDVVWVSTALDAAEEEVCRLARCSGQLMASRAPHRRQMNHLVAERSTLESRLHLKERELSDLLRKLSVDDDSLENTGSVVAIGRDSCSVSSSSSVANRVRSLWTVPTSDIGLVSSTPDTTQCARSSSFDFGRERNTIINSGIDDPASLEELRLLLQERNELRCRLIEMDEEIRVLEQEGSNDPEVEGPLPPEPLDKLRPGWKEKPDIKIVFRQLLRRLAEMASKSE